MAQPLSLSGALMRPRTPRASRHGFTLIEILVVVAIIMILVALLLPAVQAVREVARRTQCLNNMLQISLATQNYESTYAVLPPGSINPTGPIANKPNGIHHNWVSQILPFIEYKNVNRNINFGVSVYNAENATVRNMVLNTFICPSDVGAIRSPGGFAQISYVGNHHDTEAPIDTTNHGVFFLNSRVRYEDIEDGNAHTIYFGERVREPGDLGWASGTKSTLRNAGHTIGVGVTVRAVVPPMPTAAPAASRKNGSASKSGGSGAGTEAPNDPVGGYSSYHSGGANFAFGDGSVRFIRAGIDPRMLQFFSNRADGETIDENR